VKFPVGPFKFIGEVQGEICDGAISWPTSWTGDQDKQPAVVEAGRYVFVTGTMAEDRLGPNEIDTGTLTLTPTYEIDGATYTYNSITLNIAESGSATAAYDLHLTYPTHDFLFHGFVEGDLCGATVTWASEFVADEGFDHEFYRPPVVTTINEHVVVSAEFKSQFWGDGLQQIYLWEPRGPIKPIPPGELTLTPTVHHVDGSTEVLDSLTLLIERLKFPGSLVVGTTGGKFFYAVNVNNWTVATETPVVQGAQQSVTYSPDGRYVAATCSTVAGGIAIISTDVGGMVWSVLPITPGLNFSHGAIYSLRWSPAGNVLAVGHASTATGEPSLTILDTSSWGVVFQGAQVAPATLSMDFSADGSRMVAGLQPSGVFQVTTNIVYNATSWTVIETIMGYGFQRSGLSQRETAISPAGTIVAITDYGEIFLKTVGGGLSAIGHSMYSYNARFSPDGKYLAFTQGHAGRVIRVHRTSDWAEVTVLNISPPFDQNPTMMFSRDSDFFFAVAGSLHAYDTETWVKVGSIDLPGTETCLAVR
jgi:hypothetical protein